MDPLSITTGCIALIGAVANVTKTIHGFVRGAREARGDMDGVERELTSLKTILQLLLDDSEDPSKCFPEALTRQVLGIVENCNTVVIDMEKCLRKYEGGNATKSAAWSFSGKEEVEKLRSSLAAHKSALDLALDMLSLSLAKDIRKDTQVIAQDTVGIKNDTERILEEISRLQGRLPQESACETDFILQRYLEDMTDYTEGVADVAEENDPEPVQQISSELSGTTPSPESVQKSDAGTDEQKAEQQEIKSPYTIRYTPDELYLIHGNIKSYMRLPHQMLRSVRLAQKDTELTQVLYSAITCPPAELANRYTSRQQMLKEKRKTELLVCINLDQPSRYKLIKPESFIETWESIRRASYSLDRAMRKKGEKDIVPWQRLVVLIVGCQGSLEPDLMATFATLGIRVEWTDQRKIHGSENTYGEHDGLPMPVEGQPVTARLYESTTAMRIPPPEAQASWREMLYENPRLGAPIQTIFCSTAKDDPEPWIKGIAGVLKQKHYIMIDNKRIGWKVPRQAFAKGWQMIQQEVSKPGYAEADHDVQQLDMKDYPWRRPVRDFLFGKK